MNFKTPSLEEIVKKMASSRLSEITTEQLEVDELKVTSAVLVGAAHHYGSFCSKENDDFMDCRIDTKDPRKCLEEGKKVTRCATEFFKKVKGACNEEFTQYWTCLDYNNQDLSNCRKIQKPYDTCMAEKLNIQRSKELF